MSHMRLPLRFALGLSVLALLSAPITACSVDVPEGVFSCDDDSDCPPGMRCAVRFCHSRSGRDGGIDRADAGCDCNDGIDCTVDDCTACTHTPATKRSDARARCASRNAASTA